MAMPSSVLKHSSWSLQEPPLRDRGDVIFRGGAAWWGTHGTWRQWFNSAWIPGLWV